MTCCTHCRQPLPPKPKGKRGPTATQHPDCAALFYAKQRLLTCLEAMLQPGEEGSPPRWDLRTPEGLKLLRAFRSDMQGELMSLFNPYDVALRLKGHRPTCQCPVCRSRRGDRKPKEDPCPSS